MAMQSPQATLGSGGSKKTSQPVERRAVQAPVIVWAVDPERLLENDLPRTKRLIDALEAGLHGEVLPIAVTKPLVLYGALDLAAGPFLREWHENREQSLRSILSDFEFERSRAPLAVDQAGETLRKRVRKLIELALVNNAQFIVVSTRSPRTVERWGLGSFADALLGSSPVPVIAISPSAEVPQRISRILFATDFSKASRRAFKSAIGWARAFRAQVVLLHSMETLDMRGPLGGSIDRRIVLDVEKSAAAKARRSLKRWSEAARKYDVDCHAVLLRGVSVSDAALLAAAEQSVDLIVVGTRRGPVGQRFLGSVARRILSAARCPVIVVREN